MTNTARNVARRTSASIAVILIAVLLIAPVSADTKGKLDAAKARLDTLLDDIESMNDTIDSMQSEMNALAARMSAVQGRIEETRDRVDSVRRDIRAAEQRLHRTQDQLDRRAAVAYQNGPGTGIDFLLGSKSLGDLNDRLEIMNGAAKSDQDLINEIQDRQNQLSVKRAQLQRLEGQLLDREASLRNESAALERKFTEQQNALAQIEDQKAEAADLIEELEAQLEKEREREERLAELRRLAREKARLAAQQEENDSPPSNETTGGGDPSPPVVNSGGPFQLCPVDPPRAYSDDFGAPRVGHTHQGNDIFAPYGTPIRAPFSGRASASNSSLGGLSVYVYGSQGYVYNAHLSSLGNLGSVSAGTIIGYVGDSGNAQGTSPHNHFEWHPGNGSAVNPFPYLNQVC